ncbi:hypothetical protein VB618_16910 [Microvirga sp. CF3062]|uniref:hypothetical protein n=1 Tax=Microvirga sp. CF3062 TaxID=3110182 RepID=UPI002E7684FA|nr:hypothetical protein [Microvirga sp. CF3062]MEE1657883.1 hypothetical protein [Microvirga sp. CF3062]
MKPWLAIIRLLSILAIVGLVLAPFTVPAVAGEMTAPMTRAGTQMESVASGHGVTTIEVPCCMPERPSMPEGSMACPLAALCHAKIVEGVSIASVVVRWFSPAQALVPGDDAAPETLAQAPPARPPQA